MKTCHEGLLPLGAKVRVVVVVAVAVMTLALLLVGLFNDIKAGRSTNERKDAVLELGRGRWFR